jgi:hypothetical protein
MADSPDLVVRENSHNEFSLNDIVDILKRVKFKGQYFKLIDSIERARNIILDIELEGPQTSAPADQLTLSEFDHFTGTLVVNDYNPTYFLYRIMEELVAHSDRFVAESFSFRGFARFSSSLDPTAISELSLMTRGREKASNLKDFYATFQRFNFLTDASRAPELGSNSLERKNRAILAQYPLLQGHMPKGLVDDRKHQAMPDHPKMARQA